MDSDVKLPIQMIDPNEASSGSIRNTNEASSGGYLILSLSNLLKCTRAR